MIEMTKELKRTTSAHPTDEPTILTFRKRRRKVYV